MRILIAVMVNVLAMDSFPNLQSRDYSTQLISRQSGRYLNSGPGLSAMSP